MLDEHENVRKTWAERFELMMVDEFQDTNPRQLAILGALARTEDSRKRMLWMHIAVTVGLVGFVFPGTMAVIAYVKAHGGALARPAATEEQAAMAAVCLVFVAICIRSFIAARRGRNAQG